MDIYIIFSHNAAVSGRQKGKSVLTAWLPLPECSEGTGSRRLPPHSLPSEAREGTTKISGGL